MKKFLTTSLIALASFWTGAAMACVGYANGSEEKRENWDRVFRMK